MDKLLLFLIKHNRLDLCLSTKRRILSPHYCTFHYLIRIAPDMHLWGKTMNNGKPKPTSQGSGAKPVPRHSIYSDTLVESSCFGYT